MRGVAIALAFAAGPAFPAPVPAPVEVRGAVCEVTLAHWFVLRYVPDEHGRLTLPFRLDPASGTVSILNAQGIEMAVEGLICGREAYLYASGERIKFRDLAAGRVLKHLICDLRGARAKCGP